MLHAGGWQILSVKLVANPKISTHQQTSGTQNESFSVSSFA
jgi:hypothetical protein